MQESHDLLSYLHQRPWARLVEKFNKCQTDAGKPSQPDNFFTEGEFNQYSVQPHWKQLILQKEQELSVVCEDTAATGPQAVVVGKPVEQQKEKGRLSSDQVAPPAATSQHNWGKMKARLPYPRSSWLTHAEQKLYLELYDKYMSYVPLKATASEMKEINQLKELQLRVASEQNEFMAFLETAARTFPQDYAYIHSEASTYIEEHLSWKRTRVATYPRYYTILDSVSLAPPMSITEHVCFVHVKTLLCLGAVPKVILPNMRPDMRPHVPLNYAKVNNNFPATPVSNTRKKVCSGDEIAETLAKKYRVDIVISASGLKCLMDNAATYPQSWELPVIVREYPAEINSSHRVVYLDQPLVPKVMSVRDKNTCYYKAALKTLLQHPRHGNPPQSCTTDEAGMPLAEGIGDSDSAVTCLEDLETFGTGVRTVKQLQGQKYKMNATELNEMKVKPEDISSQSVRNPNVASSTNICVDDGENNGRTNEMRNLCGTEANHVDTRLMEVNRQFDNCQVGDVTQKTDTIVPTSGVIKTKGVLVVDRKQLDDADSNFFLNTNSCDSDSDDALVIDISANFDSQDGGESEVNSVSCDTTSEVVGQSAGSEVIPTSDDHVEMSQDVSELGNGTVGHGESTDVKIKHEISSEVNLLAQIEMKVVINEAEKNYEDSVCAEVKENIDGLKEEVKMEEITVSELTTKSLRRVSTRMMTQGCDDTEDVGDKCDTTSDVSITRRQSLRRRTRATNDASPLNNTTPMVEVVLRRSLRLGVKRSSMGESNSEKMLLGSRRRTRSDTGTGKRKKCEDDPMEGSEEDVGGKQGWTQPHTDTHTDINTGQMLTSQTHEDSSTATNRRRSSRLTSKMHKVMTTAVVSNTAGLSNTADGTNLTTGCKKRRSRQCRSDEGVSGIHQPGATQRSLPLTMTLVSGNKKTCSNVMEMEHQDEREEMNLDTGEDTNVVITTRNIADASDVLGDNHSHLSENVIAEESADVSKDANSCEIARGSNSAVVSEDSPYADIAMGNNLTGEVVNKNMTSIGCVNEVKDLSDVSGTISTSDTEKTPWNGADAGTSDRNIDGAQKIATAVISNCPIQTSAEVSKERRDGGRDDTDNNSARSSHKTEKRIRQAVVENTNSNQGHPKASCQSSVHTPLEEIMLAQQKLLQPTYPSRQQSSGLPSSGSTATQPPSDQTVAKPLSEQPKVPSGEWEMCEDPASYPAASSTRSDVSYDLWTLGDIRVLVRSHCHGNIKTRRKPMYHVEMTPKLEYQPIFGMEQVTPSEAARNWTSLCIHNNCRLVRARINCFTSEVMMLEEVDMRQVVPPRCAFQPASALSVLHRILTKLLSLASGQYLLSHTPGSGHANLKRSTHNNTGAYDLHLAHLGSPASDVSILGNRTVPWIPLDTSILLPHHKKYYRVPATFEPKAGKSQPKVQQKQKKKKRKKKKKGQGQAAAATGKQN